MLRLSLLRHAKSSWDDPRLDDFSRPLAKRGAKAASAIGQHVSREGLAPDLMLCSGAVRARATLALVLAELAHPLPDVRHDDALYLASPLRILDIVQKVEDRYPHVMVIGHNPGMHALALDLVGDGERKEVAQLARAFPTGALATFSFALGSWASVHAAGGRLEAYVVPRDL